jgi:hypothetical protein
MNYFEACTSTFFMKILYNPTLLPKKVVIEWVDPVL